MKVRNVSASSITAIGIVASICALAGAHCGGPAEGGTSQKDSDAGPGGAVSSSDGGKGGATSGDAGGGGGGGTTGDGGGSLPVPSSVAITVEPDGTKVAQNLLTAIDGAKAAVHVEMYLLTNATYISELIKLHQKGVDVKVVLNQTFPPGTAAPQTNAATYTQLMNAGVNVHWAPTTTGFDGYTHAKTVIIDPGTANAQAWIMTMNLDTDAPKYNREYLATDTTAADVTEAEDIFQADYASTKITPTGNLVVAPSPQNDAEAVLLKLINAATKTIDVEAEEYDSSGLESSIANALIAKAKAGVTVRMVLENSTNASQAAAVAALESAGGKVVGYTYSAGALAIHAKAIVVDGSAAYVGSINLSGGSIGYNRELGVYFTDATEVGKVSSTIAKDFAGGGAYSSK